MNHLKVLIACEESQAVCKAFRELGHNAFSCDIQDCSGGHPEWHIKGDVLYVLSHNYPWDLIIAHPPCTDLADGRQQRSIEFFMMFTQLSCPHVAIENPICIMSTHYRKPDQIIQPYEFGHPYTKKTCLWLKNLPLLKPTNILEKPAEGWVNQSFTPDGRYGGFNGKFNGSKTRSKTFPGIAKAMAEQWSRYILEEDK